MNIIKDLYYGELNPQNVCEEVILEESKLLNTITDNEEILSKSLDDDKKKLLLELLNASSEFIGMNEIDRFVAGWRLGARFMLDTFLIQEN